MMSPDDWIIIRKRKIEALRTSDWTQLLDAGLSPKSLGEWAAWRLKLKNINISSFDSREDASTYISHKVKNQPTNEYDSADGTTHTLVPLVPVVNLEECVPELEPVDTLDMSLAIATSKRRLIEMYADKVSVYKSGSDDLLDAVAIMRVMNGSTDISDLIASPEIVKFNGRMQLHKCYRQLDLKLDSALTLTDIVNIMEDFDGC